MSALWLATKLLVLSEIELRLTLISTDYKDIYFHFKYSIDIAKCDYRLVIHNIRRVRNFT